MIVQIVALLVAITFHELAHGWVAYRLGDNTAQDRGRLTLNPIAHIDLFGTIIFPLLLVVIRSPILFGWAKPVPVNPLNLKNPRKDMLWVALGGPGINLIIAVIGAVILRLWEFLNPHLLQHMLSATSITQNTGMQFSFAVPILWFLISLIQINVILAIFNLIPVPPLDGGRIINGLLPPKQAESYSKIEPFGIMILFLLLYVGIIDYIIMPVSFALMNILISF